MLKFRVLMSFALLIIASCKPITGGKSISGGGGGNLPSSDYLMKMIQGKLDPKTYCEVFIGQDEARNREQNFFTPVIPANGKNEYKEEWSEHIMDKLSSDPRLNKKFLETDDLISDSELNRLGCPGFKYASKKERQMFWALFFAAIAYPESSYNTKTHYREKDGTGSAGLLQIDQGRANAQCRSKTGINYSTSSLKNNPKENLECGLWILYDQFSGVLSANRVTLANGERRNKWLFSPDKSGVSYWSVLRNGRNGQRKLFEHFKVHSIQLPFCKRTSRLEKIEYSDIGEQNPSEAKCESVQNIQRNSPDFDSSAEEDGGNVNNGQSEALMR